MSKKTKAPAMLICERTGVEFPYVGYGRPPKYCPAAKLEIERERRRKAYETRQAKKGKTVRPRLAA